MRSHTRSTQRSRADTRCWQIPDVSKAVVFHGHHDYEFLAHSHDVVTLILVTEGVVEITVEGGGRHHVQPGQLVLIGAHQVHSARPLSAHGWEMRSLHLPPSILQFPPESSDDGSPVFFSRPVHTRPDPAKALFLDWHRRSESRDPYQHHGAYFPEILLWLRAHIQEFEPRRSENVCSERELRAKHIISATVFENRSIDSIAEEVGLSSFALIRRFKRAFGISPHGWRMQARANAAARLLLNKESLVDVAAICGFADQAHMARVFRRVFGVTPGQYRSMQ